jgi:hypothetical protein
MSLKNYYATIAIFELHETGIVTIESISVAKGECVLSGAWEFSLDEKQVISNVISGKLIIPLGDSSKIRNLLPDVDLKFVETKTFLQEAKEAATQALTAFESFKSEDPKKRKNLTGPNFFDWPETLDFNFSSEYLESIGKMATPVSTPDVMKRTLAAARLVKFLIDMWQKDEQERANRKYVEGLEAEITILPESWLAEFTSIRGM